MIGFQNTSTSYFCNNRVDIDKKIRQGEYPGKNHKMNPDVARNKRTFDKKPLLSPQIGISTLTHEFTFCEVMDQYQLIVAKINLT